MRRIIEARVVNDLLGEEVPLPTYATDGSAAIDLRAWTVQPWSAVGLLGLIGAPLLHGSPGHVGANAISLLMLGTLAGIKHGVVQDKLFLPGLMKLKRLIDGGFRSAAAEWKLRLLSPSMRARGWEFGGRGTRIEFESASSIGRN